MQLVFNQVTVLQSHYLSRDFGTNVREMLLSFILSKFKRILYTIVDFL